MVSHQLGRFQVLCFYHLPWQPLQTALQCTCSLWAPCQWWSLGSTPHCRKVGKEKKNYRITIQCQDTTLLFSVLYFCQSRTKVSFQMSPLQTFAGLKQWKAQTSHVNNDDTSAMRKIDLITVLWVYCHNRTVLSFLFSLTEVGHRNTSTKIMSLAQRRVLWKQWEVYRLLVIIHSLECKCSKRSIIIHRE